ncbi:dTDP-4-amino-4,6-dideoxygalactose transaminase [Fluviicoccus keumensis]|uniref:GDP-perosamine synthase n=1 Tax=Fluviicoccus keumensis TaxID=1435465 RepID=A0A4V2G643_9GAMM|nr:aminotransferase class I/II-fold pyridoxal phosphate-dependent enzyme [Fluviicoccus keumensis]RZU47266.1 dTDP-4-amino-4,6-dideoxygalactose transaminase [Fluviicoccus keumensis]
MNNQVSELIVHGESTVRAAMELLDHSGERILLLLDNEGRLLRTLTDGDIRRYLLSGRTLDDTLEDIPAQTAVTMTPSTTPQQALALMNARGIDHLPVLDELGRPVGLLARCDIHAPILLSIPHMSEHEREYVEQAFATNWIAPLGPNVDAFEAELAEYVGVGHAAALSSGTAAIHLALHILGVGRGDTVFCSSLTFIGSSNPILYLGAEPVFIDSEPNTWNMSPVALARALDAAARKGRLPKAVIVVNLYGQSADMHPIQDACDRYGVPIVEDAAESLGATYRGKASGTLGAMGIYSFNGNKIITTSGGGMLVSDNPDYIQRAKFLATQGREPAPHYEHKEMAYNYRMSNVLAGIGRGQLRVLEDRVAARRAVYARYVEGLAGLPVSMMPEPGFGRATHWLSALTLDRSDTSLCPSDLLRTLSSELIEGRPIWKPMHLQPLFAGCEYYAHGADGTSISERLFAEGICLPSGSTLTEKEQEHIIKVIRTALAT